jgi:hypothetical protein
MDHDLNVARRRLAWLLGLTALALVPWTVWLTYRLPSRHVTQHYDVAWVGFDIGLAVLFAATAWAALRGSHLVVPLAAATAAMLVCDAWFDVVTSWETGAVLTAALAELPLAAVCGVVALRGR